MNISIIIYAGLYLLAMAGIAIIYKLIGIATIYLFGRPLKINFFDINGKQHEIKMKLNSDDDLIKLINEVNSHIKDTDNKLE